VLFKGISTIPETLPSDWPAQYQQTPHPPPLFEMIVYRDVISGDEMISDSFKLLEVVNTDGTKVRFRLDSLVEPRAKHCITLFVMNV